MNHFLTLSQRLVHKPRTNNELKSWVEVMKLVQVLYLSCWRTEVVHKNQKNIEWWILDREQKCSLLSFPQFQFFFFWIKFERKFDFSSHSFSFPSLTRLDKIHLFSRCFIFFRLPSENSNLRSLNSKGHVELKSEDNIRKKLIVKKLNARKIKFKIIKFKFKKTFQDKEFWKVKRRRLNSRTV